MSEDYVFWVTIFYFHFFLCFLHRLAYSSFLPATPNSSQHGRQALHGPTQLCDKYKSPFSSHRFKIFLLGWSPDTRAAMVSWPIRMEFVEAPCHSKLFPSHCLPITCWLDVMPLGPRTRQILCYCHTNATNFCNWGRCRHCRQQP